jgi:hypothetical protein
MKNKLNVLDLVEFKEIREVKRCQESYGRYLKTLPNGELEIEVNYLLNEFSEDAYGKDFFSKGKMILKEISSRAYGGVKKKIELMTEETLKLL